MAVDNTHFKGSWRPEEDAALREAVSRHGEKNWSTVARTFNQLMGRPALLGRAPKQCRSRYLQQLVPGIKTGEWSIEEEEILVEGHKQFGNQWTLIASMLPGRTETSVKNHYNCTARRKVPADPNRMTILQRYLAAIGIIAAPGGSKGGSGGAAAKYPSLGSGYPNSNSGMYYQGAGTGTTATSSAAAAAAAAAAAGKAAAARSRRGTSAPAAVHSPSASHMGYDEYEGTTELAHAYSEADYSQAYAAYQAYQSMEQQQQHMAAAAAAAAAAAMQHDHADAEGEDEVAAEGGAADGLLQLAHAAMMHLEELGGEGDDDEEDDEEGEEGAGSGNGEARQRSASKQQQHAAGEECYADNEHEHEQQQQQHQQVAASSTGKGGEVAASGSKAGSKSPAGRPLPAWLKPDLALSVMSSEESDRTAEEPDEGSPLAEQLLRQHLKSGSKRGSPSTAAAAALGGRTQPASGAAPGAKRPRSIWGAEEAAVAAAAVGAGGPVDAAAAGALAAAAAGRRFTRPVLDVSEPEGTGSCVPPPLSLPVGPVSPGVPSVGSNSAPLSELNAHLVAMLMGAFMGAADSSAASAPASALPTDALAAIARVMASSLAAAGQSQQQQQQHQSSPPPAAMPSKMPASQLAAQGDA